MTPATTPATAERTENSAAAPSAAGLEWSRKLVAFDTTSRNSNLDLIHSMAAELTAHGLTPVIVPSPDGNKANLFATIPAGDGAVTGGVMLAGHTDVVPVDGQAWDSDPFTPEVREGRLYGRGTTDMKAFSGAILGFLPEFLSRPLAEPLHFAWTYDEEVGCHGAVVLLAELAARGIHPRLGFVGEPTSMRPVSAHKSSQLFRVTVTGLAAHSSMTSTGVNAIEYAARAIAFIRSLADEHRLSGPFDETFVVPYTTANVGVVSGGAAVNTVAEKCDFEFEFRTIPGVDPQSVIARIEDSLAGLRTEIQQENPSADIHMDALGTVPGLSPEGPRAALDLAQRLTGNAVEESVVYATEAGLFQRAGIDTVVCGPGSMDQGHTANEYIELSQIAACETFLQALADHLSTERTPPTMSHSTPAGVASEGALDTTPAAVTALERSNARKAVVAASIGNGLEWFDLIVYGTFAVTISKLFFPTTSEAASLLLTFASFGVSFIMRPLGGILIGRYADKAGRKAGMLVSILVMFVGTLLIVIAPTAAAIGVTASILVLVARLLQGFATGGEFGTATAYLIEYAPTRKAFYGSWQVATQGGGILLAGIFGFVLNTYLSAQALESWGWRLPFIFALAIGPVGWYIRSKMEETPEFLATETSKAPLKETFVANGGRLWAIVGVVSLGSVGVYIALFMPTYAIVNLGMPKAVAFLSTLIFGIVMSLGSPFIGMLSDKVGPARVMTWAAGGTIVVGIPAFLALIAAPELPTMIVVELVLSVLATAYFAPLPAIMSSMFPARIRSTGLSLGYNIGVTVFGGFAPFILTALIGSTGSLLVPGYYLVAIAVIAAASLAIARKVYRQA